MRARARLWMVLHRERRQRLVAHSLDGTVVEIDVRNLETFRNGLRHDCEVVVLARYLHLARREVLHGVVAPMMPELEPCRLRAACERKQLMLDLSDVFIALPGGVGTLDEVFTVAASYTIGYHHKHVILYNMKGFWNSLIDMMDDLQKRGVIRQQWQDWIAVANSLEDIERLLA